MKSVLVIVSVLALAHHAYAATCSEVPEYNTTLVPACAGNDVFVLWPNYENFTQYYRCQGAGNPKLVDCAAGTYFSYYLQICNACEDYLPAPICEDLKTSNTPNCVAIVSATTTTLTTTTMTTTTMSTTTTTGSTTTPAPTTTTSTITTTPAPTTTPTTTVGVPSPPSPSTSAPGVPTPPTPAPTPPTVPGGPPSEAPLAI